jgi:hypothetical protein
MLLLLYAAYIATAIQLQAADSSLRTGKKQHFILLSFTG